MTTELFLGFVAVMAGIVVALVARYIKGRFALWVAVGLSVWFLYAGLLGYSGVLQNTTARPPGILLLIIPIFLFLLFFLVLTIRPAAGARLATAFPLWIILAMQSFRIVVELFLHQLWLTGLIPRMLTFKGANVDIYIGSSAALIALLSTRGSLGVRVALVWNGLGLLALGNVVVRAILTAPGPLHLIHAEVPNRMLGTFPFLLIPGFFVPLAFVLHMVAIRAIVSRSTPKEPVAIQKVRAA